MKPIVIAICALVVLGVWSHAPLCGLAAVCWPLGAIAFVTFDQRLTRSRERARLCYDCEMQHDAWKAGRDDVATYGRFPSTDI